VVVVGKNAGGLVVVIHDPDVGKISPIIHALGTICPTLTCPGSADQGPTGPRTGIIVNGLLTFVTHWIAGGALIAVILPPKGTAPKAKVVRGTITARINSMKKILSFFVIVMHIYCITARVRVFEREVQMFEVINLPLLFLWR
jgi:hypothetical protein